MENMNGIIDLLTFSIDSCPILQAKKSTVPTGGVKRPMHSDIIIIKPNWIELIPNCWTIGKKIGTKIINAGVMSITVPTNKSKIKINR